MKNKLKLLGYIVFITYICSKLKHMSEKIYLLLSDLNNDNIGVLELDKDNVSNDAIFPKLNKAFTDEYGLEDVEIKEFEIEGHHPLRVRVVLVGDGDEYLLFLNQTWVY